MADGELVVCFNVLFCPVANSTMVTCAVLKHYYGDKFYRIILCIWTYHKPSVSHDLSYVLAICSVINYVVMSSIFMSCLLLGRFHDLTQRHIVYCVMSFYAAHILYRSVLCFGYTPLGEVVFCCIL